jgi:arginine exporter protein ArgO
MPLNALLIGMVAGLAVAMPLGAIGVLVVQEGITRGWATAAASATGVALVDLCYAAVAVTAGSAVTGPLTAHSGTVHLMAAAVLLVIAVRGLLITIRTMPGGLFRGVRVAGPSAEVRRPEKHPDPVGGVVRFAGLTAINPLTAVYFVALAAGLNETVTGSVPSAFFVLGVFVASWGWQLGLATFGSVLGDRLGGRARTVTGLLGHLVVLWYAGMLAYR